MKNDVSAHRGNTTNAPENTTASYIAAGKNKKYIAIESDIHDTADGQLVMIHDNYLARVTNIGKNDRNRFKPLSQLTLKKIQSYSIKANVKGKTKVYKNLHVPTFAQYLDICKKYHKIACIDLKTFNNNGSLQKMIRIIRAKGMQNKVLIMGYRTGYLENINHAPGGGGLRMCALFMRNMTNTEKQIILENGIGCVSVDLTKQTKAEAKWCKKYGIIYAGEQG
jgi:glycerophosphoryl diester phosphodiesterase